MRISFAVLGRLVVLLPIALVLASPSPALASGAQVLAECNRTQGPLAHQYSVAELRNALSTISADVKEYTDCYDVIQRALLGRLAASPRATHSASDQVASGPFLPTGLILVLAVLGLLSAALGVLALRRHFGSPRSGET